MTSKTNSILDELQDICREVFEDPTLVLTPETTAKDVPNWDSFNHLNVVVAAEQRFGIRFRTSEVESLRNVGDFIDVIRTKQKY
jgi:acyl carrier protein